MRFSLEREIWYLPLMSHPSQRFSTPPTQSTWQVESHTESPGVCFIFTTTLEIYRTKLRPPHGLDIMAPC